MPAAARAPHVILFPMPVQGHINPFISIADYLTASGISVTLVHTARSHSLLSRSSNAKLGGHLNKYRIEVVPDAMPPDNKQLLSPDHVMASLPLMRQGLEDLLEKLMQEDPPSCMIMDSFLPWGHQVAVKYGLPRVEVWTCSASVFSMGYHFPEIVARGFVPAVVAGSQEKTVDFIPGVSAFRIADMPKVFGVDDLQSPVYHFFRSVFQHSKDADRILVPTVYELESSAVDALRKHAGICIDPVGPLFAFNSSGPGSPAASLLSEDNSCLTWLDQQEKSSVLYVSFGSVASVEEEEFRELALGLEASGERFLWVIRPGAIKGNTGVEEVLLPEGFLARTQDRGLIISWAPQLAVLAHPAVGAFFTHCGWNSTLESLYMGVPMLGLPQGAEQNTNLKYIVQDWKVGRALVQPGEKCDRSCVERAVRAMMRGDEGTEARGRALEWREVAHEAIRGSSKANLQRLVDDLKHGKVKPPSSHA